jgi:hypothetical protein
MKYTDKAVNYLRRLPEKLTKSIPESIFVLSVGDTLPKNIQAKNCIALADKLDTRDVINFANSTGVGHVVQVAQDSFENEMQIAIDMIGSPDRFLTEPVTALFGLTMNAVKWPFVAFHQKEGIKKEIVKYILEIPNGNLIKTDALAVADELFKNALHHHAEKEMTVAELRELKLDDRLAASIFIAHRGDRLLIGCSDLFGTLDTGKMMKLLWASFRGEKIQSINMGAGGAGIGCRLILNQCVGFYAACKGGERTTICGVLSMDRHSKFMIEQSKNFHLNF